MKALFSEPQFLLSPKGKNSHQSKKGFINQKVQSCFLPSLVVYKNSWLLGFLGQVHQLPDLVQLKAEQPCGGLGQDSTLLATATPAHRGGRQHRPATRGPQGSRQLLTAGEGTVPACPPTYRRALPALPGARPACLPWQQGVWAPGVELCPCFQGNCETQSLATPPPLLFLRTPVGRPPAKGHPVRSCLSPGSSRSTQGDAAASTQWAGTAGGHRDAGWPGVPLGGWQEPQWQDGDTRR